MSENKWKEIKHVFENYPDLIYYLPSALTSCDGKLPGCLRAEFEKMSDNLNLPTSYDPFRNYSHSLWKYIALVSLVSFAISFSIGSIPQMRS